MVDTEKVILTSEEVANRRAKKGELEKVIANAQQELSGINRWLEAVSVLTEGRSIGFTTSEDDVEEVLSAESPQETMIDAVERVVKEAGEPMTKAAIKKELANAGFSKSRLGNYFYTVIARLKERDKIVVRQDGRVVPGIQSLFS